MPLQNQSGYPPANQITPTWICNAALGALGVNRLIGDINEKSAAGQAFRTYFWPELRKLLRDFAWPLATKTIQLQEVLGIDQTPPTPPNVEWQYCYKYPSDCLFFRRIWNGIPWYRDTRRNRVPYRIAKFDFDNFQNPLTPTYNPTGNAGPFIFTNMPQAIGEYTYYPSEFTTFPDDFIEAFYQRLASKVAAMLTGGDPYQLGPKAKQDAIDALHRAQNNAFNEEQMPMDPPSEFEQFRNGVFFDWQQSMPGWDYFPKSGFSIS